MSIKKELTFLLLLHDKPLKLSLPQKECALSTKTNKFFIFVLSVDVNASAHNV
jgi:hypothetical protein